MLYSKYCEYVIKALAYLSLYSNKDKYIMVREISNKLGIPYHFLSKIFQDLSTTKWVISKKGKNGGFTLAADPAQLTLMDIIKWSDGIHNFNKCVLGDRECGQDYKCTLHNKCSDLRNRITEFFDTMTIYDVSEINHDHQFVKVN
jgi:Rrf2 family iron-sulfur cluster assembly transcriptional regulator